MELQECLLTEKELKLLSVAEKLIASKKPKAMKIMFNDKYGLTKAVLDGRKTMTRRIINPQPSFNDTSGIVWKGYAYGLSFSKTEEECYYNFIRNINYNKDYKGFKNGGIVAIAQRYQDIVCNSSFEDWEIKNLRNSEGWNNKMFVKAEFMPNHIRITDVRLERLQDISDEDCLREGIQEDLKCVQYSFDSNIGFCNQYPYGTPRSAFAALIDKVSGNGTWESNPYVFVYEFELIKK